MKNPNQNSSKFIITLMLKACIFLHCTRSIIASDDLIGQQSRREKRGIVFPPFTVLQVIKKHKI